jgi:hypothetical protein
MPLRVIVLWFSYNSSESEGIHFPRIDADLFVGVAKVFSEGADASGGAGFGFSSSFATVSNFFFRAPSPPNCALTGAATANIDPAANNATHLFAFIPSPPFMYFEERVIAQRIVVKSNL